MTTFFTADTHFGDHGTINLQRRPFASVADIDEAMVVRWNAVVGPEDLVWHLGDVARRADGVEALLTRLNGTKHLLRGNNDPDATSLWRAGQALATMPKWRSTGVALSFAIIPSAAGTANTRAQSTCTATAMNGCNQFRASSTSGSMSMTSRP
jgi:calcineurin-like phosphoesterase family protein